MPATVEVKCANKSCGEMFTARVADRKRGWGKFCSKSCKAIKQERRTSQHECYKVRQKCRDQYGFTPVYFERDGSMYAADGQGVDKHGQPAFIGNTFYHQEYDLRHDGSYKD